MACGNIKVMFLKKYSDIQKVTRVKLMLETGLKISYKNTYTKLAFEKCIINGIVQKKPVKAST